MLKTQGVAVYFIHDSTKHADQLCRGEYNDIPRGCFSIDSCFGGGHRERERKKERKKERERKRERGEKERDVERETEKKRESERGR